MAVGNDVIYWYRCSWYCSAVVRFYQPQHYGTNQLQHYHPTHRRLALETERQCHHRHIRLLPNPQAWGV